MVKKQFIEIGIGHYSECLKLIDNPCLWGLPVDIDWTGIIVDFQPFSLRNAMLTVRERNLSDKISIFNAVVSTFSDVHEVKLNLHNEIDAHASLADAKTDREDCSTGRMYCPAISLNDLVNKVMRLRYVDIGLLAIDVQGSEADILGSYHWIHEPDYIKIETHSPQLDREVEDILQPRYRIIKDLTCEHDRKVGRPNRLWKHLKFDPLFYGG